MPLPWHPLLLFLISLHFPEEPMLRAGGMRGFAPRRCDGLMAELGTTPSTAPAFCWTMMSKPRQRSLSNQHG